MKTSNIAVTYVDHSGSDLSIVNAARVSFDKESFWKEYEENNLFPADSKLINYLAKHRHFSPFNHCFITLRVKAPIFVARQLVKHKFMPWNEVSRRYVDSEPEFYMPEILRSKAKDVKQGSTEEPINQQEHKAALAFIRTSVNSALNTYTFMLEKGVCPEQARMVLPLNTMTEWIWSGTLGAYADMLHLRLDNHTQAETREVAEKAKAIIEPLFPVGLKALLENK